MPRQRKKEHEGHLLHPIEPLPEEEARRILINALRGMTYEEFELMMQRIHEDEKNE